MEAEGWVSVDRWISRLAPSTGKRDIKTFKVWLRWVAENGGELAGLTPDELVEYQRNTDNGTRYRILDEVVQPYVLTKKGRVRYKEKIYSTIRSFFLHNRAELPRDPNFTLRGDKPSVRGTLTVEELKKLVLSSKPLYQAVFLSMFQGGMDHSAFEYWNLNGWDELKVQLERGDHPVKVSLPGRKKDRNRRPYYTYLGRDAVEAVRDYVGNHRPKDARAIFVNQYGDPVTRNALYLYWVRHLRKIRILDPKTRDKTNRTGKNPHEMRDVFRSQWEKSPAKGSVAEFMMQHRVDPLEYVKSFRDEGWTRREYLKAEEHLNILSSGRPFGRVDVEEVERLRSEMTSRDAKIQKLERDVAEWKDMLRLLFEEGPEALRSRAFLERLEKRPSA